MKKFLSFTVPILLSALACSDIELGPFWGEFDLPDGPALGLRDIAASDDGVAWIVGMGGEAWYYDGELEFFDPPTDENLQDLAPVNADEGWAAAQTHLLGYR